MRTWEAGVRRALKKPGLKLWDFIKEGSDLDEAQFADAVERRLNTSRFMVLIIGDGIPEGVEALTGYLQLHAGLHVGVALVDLSIWQAPDSALLVVPRIPLRTVLVERGIVVVQDGGQARVDSPAVRLPSGVRTTTGTARPTTASEPEYYEQLEARRPGLPQLLRPFVSSLESLGVLPDFRKSLNLRWRPSPDEAGTFGYIDVDGRVWVGGGWGTAKRLGKPEAGERYLQDVADTVSGSIRRYDKSWPEVVGNNGRPLDAEALLKSGEKWKQAMLRLMTELRTAIDPADIIG